MPNPQYREQVPANNGCWRFVPGNGFTKPPHPSITFFRVCAKSWQQANNWRSRGKRPEKSIECKKPSEFNFQIKGLWFSEIKRGWERTISTRLEATGQQPLQEVCSVSILSCGLRFVSLSQGPFRRYLALSLFNLQPSRALTIDSR